MRGEYSKYYTGEAYWALARLERVFPDEGFGAVADRIGAYLATTRDEAEDYWPPIADHWAGYGLADTAERHARSPRTSAPTRASRPGCSVPRRAGSRRGTGRGAPWSAAATSAAACSA